MAKSYIDIVRLIEAHVPQAAGGANQDDILRQSLITFANQTIDEVMREQRWSLSYAEPFFTTTSGTENYSLPFPAPATIPLSNLFLTRVYYVNSTGRPVVLERMDQREAQRVFGESMGLGASATIPPVGPPVKFAILAATATAGGIDIGSPALTIYLYPTPDTTGPETNGNYKIRMAGYYDIPDMVETHSNLNASDPTMNFSTTGSGNYILANGVLTTSVSYDQTVAVRNGGFVTGLSAGAADTLVTGWSAITGNSATMTPTLPGNSPVDALTVFNASNWIITHWPKLLLFGILREVGNYYGKADMFQIWDAKFKEQMDKLRQYEFDRQRGIEMLAVVQVGQKAAALRRQDLMSFIDIRGSGGF